MTRRDTPAEQLEDLDKEILKTMLDLRGTKMSTVSRKIGVSKSTVHNRLKRLKQGGFIEGMIPMISEEKVKGPITAVSLVSARYGPGYGKSVGASIARIKGVWAVYFVLGDIDFIVLIRTRDKDELARVLEELANIPGVEGSETIMALETVKEDYVASVKCLLED
ncbi:MAG: Lrp/AsnC family transcriptional regulator [Thermoplasmata archaeon]